MKTVSSAARPEKLEREALTWRRYARLLRHKAYVFPELLAPLVLNGASKLADELRPISGTLGDLLAESAWDCLWDGLADRLSRILVPTLYREFASFRAERPFRPYREFCRLSLRRNYSNLTVQYTGLSSRVHLEISAFVRSTTLLLNRLVLDRGLLSRTLLSNNSLRIATVSLALSEPHDGGLSTHALTTEGGISFLYKPKRCTGDRLFHHVMETLGNRNQKFALRAPRILVRRDYAWSEHIPHVPLSQPADSFYFRVGTLLAVAYALRASDVTSDNLIAAGDCPVLVDAEVVLLAHRADQPLRAFSVTDIGLLPCTALQSLGGRLLDQSGLAQHRHVAIGATWVDLNTDHMRRAPTLVAADEPVNVPCTVDGARAPYLQYATQIVAGFSEAYAELMKSRSALLRDIRFRRLVKCTSSRVILRSTDRYLLAIQRTLHPDSFALPEAERMEILRKSLKLDTGGIAIETELECVALARGDVPHFHSKADSLSIYSAAGRIDNFLVETPRQALLRHIEAMSTENCRTQIAKINQTLAARRL